MIIAASRALQRRCIPLRSATRTFSRNRMTQIRSAKASLSHEERTATEPRDKGLHPVVLDEITAVNDRIRTFKFAIKDTSGINFLPGQWLDVHVPGIEKAGGFTITSSPRHAIPTSSDNGSKPFLELAIQKSPDNPPAAWLWQPAETILGKEVAVRVGGSFVWPPPGVDVNKIKRAVFIAGGVGINPLISMLSHIREQSPSLEVCLLYSTKLPSKHPDRAEVLFLPRILELFRTASPSSDLELKNHVNLFFTGAWDGSQISDEDECLCSFSLSKGIESETYYPAVASGNRIDEAVLSRVVGTSHQQTLSSVFYVCGPPDMTDSIVQYLREQDYVAPERVLCEKWW